MCSGATGVTTLKHGQKFCGYELEEDFFELAKERLEKWLLVESAVQEHKQDSDSKAIQIYGSCLKKFLVMT